MSSHAQQPCEYQECQCVVIGRIPGAAYCSDVCETRDTSDESFSSACECGHSPCDAGD